MKKIVIISLLLLLLTACSKTHSVTVTYEANGGTVFPATSIVNSASTLWYPSIPQKENYLFVNWYINPECTTLYMPSYLEDNDSLTLYARYIEVDQTDFYIVSFVSMGGTYTPNQLVVSGDHLQIPVAPTKEGYVFNRWIHANTLSNLTGNVDFGAPITEHMTVEAEYSSTSSAKN